MFLTGEKKRIKHIENRIYTFWEPKDRIPGYLQLCKDTWNKFLPEYEVIVLNYSNLSDYISKDYYDDYLYNNFSLPKQSDAIRAAILKEHGGIWLDMDTIITSEKIKNILEIKSDFILIGRHICFIISTPNAFIINQWVKEIKEKILEFKNYNPNLYKKIFDYKNYKYYTNWDYIGNSILNKYFISAKQNDLTFIKKSKVQPLLENIYGKKCSQNAIKRYKLFYFSNQYDKNILNNNGGIIFLHNSWTPKKYKKMNKDEFLNQDILLSKLLKEILYKN